MLWKADYVIIVSNRSYFSAFDSFGNYDLLLGAAKINLKIVDMPIRYHEHTYSTNNNQRWKNGRLLLQIVLFTARQLNFL
jgi:hypothetical protein